MTRHRDRHRNYNRGAGGCSRQRRAKEIIATVGLLLATLFSNVGAQQTQAYNLVKEARNPLAELISLQVQPNFNFGVGQNRDTEYVFNIQPVIPIHLFAEWDLITRTIVPLLNEPPSGPDEGYTFGIGDIQTTLFLSPPSSTRFIWGFGPVLQFPSASAMSLGSGKWEIGPALAGILTLESWVIGAQAYNLWSFAGDSTQPEVNHLLLQPLLTYTLLDDWYLTSSPQVTADWKAGSRERWTVPVGGGIGKLLPLGRQQMIVQVEGYHNAERPTGAAAWSTILTVQFLFP